MKKLIFCLVCVVAVVLITGCESTGEYYCDDGDTLISDTCIHKSTSKAMLCGYSNTLGCTVASVEKCGVSSGICMNLPTWYKCSDGDLIGDTCVKETTYKAHTK